jgi:hypothetical protein
MNFPTQLDGSSVVGLLRRISRDSPAFKPVSASLFDRLNGHFEPDCLEDGFKGGQAGAAFLGQHAIEVLLIFGY